MAEPALSKREQTKAQNRAAILTAAKDVFLQMGYDGCNVRDIIRRTGLAAGTFYNYFPDKLSVFKALIDDFMQRLSEDVHQVREGAESLEDFLTRSYQVFFHGIADDPVSYELARRNEAVIGNLYDSSVMELVEASLKRDIELAQQRGLMPDLDIDYLSGAFIGVGLELGRRMQDRRPMNPQQAARFATQLFLGGIDAAAKAAPAP